MNTNAAATMTTAIAARGRRMLSGRASRFMISTSAKENATMRNTTIVSATPNHRLCTTRLLLSAACRPFLPRPPAPWPGKRTDVQDLAVCRPAAFRLRTSPIHLPAMSTMATSAAISAHL